MRTPGGHASTTTGRRLPACVAQRAPARWMRSLRRDSLATVALVLLGWARAGAAGSPPTAELASAAAVEATQVDRGIVIAISVAGRDGGALHEDDSARVTVRLSDRATRTPLRGVYPTAWMGTRPASGDRRTCAAAVASYASADYFRRAQLDLNTYQVVALNADATLTVVDPRFSFGGSRLLAVLPLRAPGFDWTLSADGARLFVALPEAGVVAVIDTVLWRQVAEVALPGRPTRLALQPDSEYVWVAYEGDAGASGVAALRATDLTLAARIDTGRGRHDLALSDDGRKLVVTNADDATASVVDTRTLRRSGQIRLSAEPVSAAWSPQSRRAYVASSDGSIAVIDAEQVTQRGVVKAQPGVRQVRFAPGGRYGFAVNPEKDLLEIFDSATDRIVQTGAMDGGPFEVTFSQGLGYVRRLRSEIVLMVPLADIGTPGQRIPVVDFPAGRAPFGASAAALPASGVVKAPGENAVLVAHPADGQVYFYREGMAAPVGQFSNDGHAPQALLVVDRTLRETAPGTFTTVARLPRAGGYSLAVLLDAPRATACFDVDVQPNPDSAARRESPPRVEQLTAQRIVTAGASVRVAVRLTHPETGLALDGVSDVSALTYRVADGWHERQPLRAAGNGRYEADVLISAPGIYYVYVESPSVRLPPSNPYYLVLDAREAVVAASPVAR
jgi:hypothetical protein